MKCIHKETGHHGIIKDQMDAGENYPAQYGIFWLDGRHGKEHAERNRILGCHSYWNDKDKILIDPLTIQKIELN